MPWWVKLINIAENIIYANMKYRKMNNLKIIYIRRISRCISFLLNK